MSKVGTYLNLGGNAEEALKFYASVFDTEILNITRYGDFQDGTDMDGNPMPEHVKSKIMNSQMLIMGDYMLQVSDHLPEFGDDLAPGNYMAMVLMPESRDETDRLFKLLVEGGTARFEPADAGFGYFADLKDQFGTCWMFFNPN